MAERSFLKRMNLALRNFMDLRPKFVIENIGDR